MNVVSLNNRGSALVEFAIVATLLLTLVFGIIECGLVMKDYLTIQQAAREGARSAATGDTTSTVIQKVIASSPATTLHSSDITLEKSASSSGGWVALSDSGGQNDAVSGGYVRVTVLLQHAWISTFFAASATTIRSVMVARRE